VAEAVPEEEVAPEEEAEVALFRLLFSPLHRSSSEMKTLVSSTQNIWSDETSKLLCLTMSVKKS
jgi:hypothetical protein